MLISSSVWLFLAHQNKVSEALLADNRPLTAYVETFEWDAAKYNVKLSIREIAQNISKVCDAAAVVLHRPSSPCA